MQKIFDLLIQNGACPAEPGEFTKRAFLNGRIDLSKAEAVMDLINAKNKFANIAAINQLNGNLYNIVIDIRKKILKETAYIEACLDDPEHMSFDDEKINFINVINNCIKEINILIKNSKNGKILKEGINTVIIGKPNAGKSSLLNFLLKEDRAIVSNIEGTTRDVIKETINLDGINLNIIDTAGIRENNIIDEIETIGIEKTKSESNKADLILLIFDSTIPFDKNICNDLLSFIDQNIPIIIILNKIDLLDDDNNLTKYKNYLNKFTTISFSTKTGYGENLLKKEIKKLFLNEKISFNSEIIITNERQIKNLIDTKNSLNSVLSAVNNNIPEDIFTVFLNDAYFYLSSIIGENVSDDLINEIFSNFCIGK